MYEQRRQAESLEKQRNLLAAWERDQHVRNLKKLQPFGPGAMRLYARETLAQCETETWRDGAGQRPGGRWTEPESASDRLFSQKGWNSVDSGFKLF